MTLAGWPPAGKAQDCQAWLSRGEGAQPWPAGPGWTAAEGGQDQEGTDPDRWRTEMALGPVQLIVLGSITRIFTAR